MTELTELTVKVPTDQVGATYAYIASLFPEAATNGTSDQDALADPSANPFDPTTVRENYRGGVSDYWRPFLQALAQKPGEWVTWTKLCEAIDLTPRQASGMLGAAERRCKLQPPYDKAYQDGEHWFRMSTGVAEVIKDLAAEDL